MANIRIELINLDNLDHWSAQGVLGDKDFETLKERLAKHSVQGVFPTAQEVVESLPVVKVGELELDQGRHECKWKGQIVHLTVTEFLLLKAVALRPGYVKTRDQLMDEAYGAHIYVDDRTIDSHVKRIRAKFRVVDPTWNEVETIYGIGYRYRAQP